MSDPSHAMPLYFHALYTDGIAPEARFPRERYRLIAERLIDQGDHIAVCESPPATDDEIAIAVSYTHLTLPTICSV